MEADGIDNGGRIDGMDVDTAISVAKRLGAREGIDGSIVANPTGAASASSSKNGGRIDGMGVDTAISVAKRSGAREGIDGSIVANPTGAASAISSKNGGRIDGMDVDTAISVAKRRARAATTAGSTTAQRRQDRRLNDDAISVAKRRAEDEGHVDGRERRRRGHPKRAHLNENSICQIRYHRMTRSPRPSHRMTATSTGASSAARPSKGKR
jgi:hypothetical protein